MALRAATVHENPTYRFRVPGSTFKDLTNPRMKLRQNGAVSLSIKLGPPPASGRAEPETLNRSTYILWMDNRQPAC
jgi:hypothetical protein